jgi:putative nucleotidyltransferase with HDIG domain
MPKSQSSGAHREAPLVATGGNPRTLGLRMLLFFPFLVAVLTLCLILPAIPSGAPLAVGTVSPRDMLARQRATYTSRILTEAERVRAEAAVEPVYALDANVARQQLARVRQILAYIASIRQDAQASAEDKARWLAKISDLVLPASVIDQVLKMDELAWQNVSSEVVYLLDRVMREGVRHDELEELSGRLPQLVSYTLSSDQAEVVAAFVRSLLKPNNLLDEELTAERRQQARAQVQPVQQTIEIGQAVIRQGDIVTPFHVEQLVALGLQQPVEQDWHGLLSRLLFVLALVFALLVYMWHAQRQILSQQKRLALLSLLMVVTAVGAKLSIPGHVLLPYLFPMAAVAMLVSVLLDAQLALVVTVLLSLFVGFVAGASLELTTYLLLGSLTGAVAISRPERLGTFAWAAVAVALVNSLVALSFRLFSQAYDSTALLQVVGASIANGLISASLTFTAFFWIGAIFGITTPLQLVELARPTHPLARRLLLEAPGTYHHSLIVGNLGERAAEMVGADPLLVRVAALHHDVGKVLRPYFFVENQTGGDNYHQQLDATTSAQIIISHVKDSLELGRKYRFPEAVLALMAQHHGTTSVGFGSFYQRASKEGEAEVDEAQFRYPGPRPRSKEAAILMLADSVEASVRASAPTSAGEIERIVRKITNDRLVSGELDECDVTLRDLETIRTAFIDVLHGVSHARLQYPEKDSMAQKPQAEA